ncbi:MAG: YicC/YloC family endoribonuclease [Beijerinckiaceae bacterium]
MALSSMTGFARSAGHAGNVSWSWEMKSVNAKGFDLRLRLPGGLDGVETEARRMIGTVVARGTIHASLDFIRGTRSAEIKINETLAAELAQKLLSVAKTVGLQPPSFDAILGVRGVVEVTEQQDTDEQRAALAEAVTTSLEEVIVGLVAARQSEGAALAVILEEKLSAIETLVLAADAHPSRSADSVKSRIRRQINDLLGNSDALDEQRLHQEAMLLAVKGDVREELDRLKAHVEQARQLFARGGAIGRRLDFLAQELSREANTLCAKSSDSGLTAIGLDLKTLVEQFREQVQNVE